MKNAILILMTLLLFNCSSDDDKPKEVPVLISKWKLIEQLLDPGDGSGTFQSVTSERVFTFREDNTLLVNGDICSMAIDVGDKVIVPYNTNATDYRDGEILTESVCSSRSFKLSYKIEGEYLIISYPCIEPCLQKFEKIE